jgi:hypothetical protein
MNRGFLCILVLALSGCTGTPAAEPASIVADEPDADIVPQATTSSTASSAPRPSSSSAPAQPVTPASNATANETVGPWSLATHGWASLESALVRPGSRIENARGTDCSANFLFTNPEGTIAYLGTAAHCFGVPVDYSDTNTAIECGDHFAPLDEAPEALMPLYDRTDSSIMFPPAPTPIGDFVYSSFVAMEEAGETEDIMCSHNDFALIELDENATRLANPAMWHWGGPVDLRGSKATTGEHVLTFGGTAAREQPGPPRQRDGYVSPSERELVDPDSDISFHAIVPGGCIGGDSGSPMTDGDGSAIGVVTRSAAGASPSCRMAYLAPMLAYMAAHGGPEVVLATADQLATLPV